MDKKSIYFIFILALVVRLVFIFLFPSLIAGDTGSYEIIAKSLVEGNGFPSSFESLTKPPAYPVFLAGVYFLFGQNYMVVKLIQAILGAINCIIIYFIARKIFNHRIGLWSGVVMALYPTLISTAGFILSEELTIFLLTISILFLTKAMKKNQVGWYALSGILLGLVTLCRSVTLLFPFFLYLSLPFLSPKKKVFIGISVFLLCMLITVSPWTIRNYIRFNTFVPVQIGGGTNLWTGSYCSQDRTLSYSSYEHEYKHPKDIEAYNKVKEGLSSPIEIDKAYYREGVKNILNNPTGYIWLCARKLNRFWLGIPGGVEVLKPYPKIKLGVTVVSYCVLLLAILGLWTGLKEDWKNKLPVLFMVFYFTIMYVLVSVAVPRFRLPIEPYVLIFAIVGFLQICNWKRKF